MANYDPVNYPKPLTPKLSQLDHGAPADQRSTEASDWPDNPLLADPYLGPQTPREFETSPGPMLKGIPVPAVPPPPDAPAPEQSVAPPPGSPPHPSRNPY